MDRITLTHAEALEALMAMAADEDPVPSGVTVTEFAKSKGWSRDRARKWLEDRAGEGKLREVETVRLDKRGRRARMRGWEPVP